MSIQFEAQVLSPHIYFDPLATVVTLSPCCHKVNQVAAEKYYGKIIGGLCEWAEKECVVCKTPILSYAPDHTIRSVAAQVFDPKNGLENLLNPPQVLQPSKIKTEEKPAENDTDKAHQVLYADYLKGKGCDCELISKNGIIIKMHASMLRGYKSILYHALNTNTPNTLVISFDKYSAATIRTFVELLYLGPEDFQKKWPTRSIPIFELMRFAHEYDPFMLYDICIRGICQCTTEEDAEKVLEVNKICQNLLLSRHYQRLIQLRNKT